MTADQLEATLLLLGFVEKETVSDAAFPIVLRHEAADINIYQNRTWGYIYAYRTSYYASELDKLLRAVIHDLEVLDEKDQGV